MSDTQSFTNGSSGQDSRLFGVSVRAIITVIVIGTACGIAMLDASSAYQAGEPIKMLEPIPSLALFIGGWYLGQKTPQKT